MKNTNLPELNSYYRNKSLWCSHCRGKMMTGIQYYAMKKSWIDLTCTKCSRGVDIEIKKLNQVFAEFNFKQIKERYGAGSEDY
jgi:hypothetical protein